MTISRWIVLRMRNVPDKSCRENQNTHFMYSKFFFFENRAVYRIMWQNTYSQKCYRNIPRRMRYTCWIKKATDTHSEYVILIAFPKQQWLRERVLLLHCPYIAYLVIIHYSIMQIWKRKISVMPDENCNNMNDDDDDNNNIFINCNWVVTRWQYIFTHKQYTEQHK
jgi:hypothetical protein